MTAWFMHKKSLAGSAGFSVIHDTPTDADRNLCIKPTPIRLSPADAVLPVADLIARFQAGSLKSDDTAKDTPCRVHKSAICPSPSICARQGCTENAVRALEAREPDLGIDPQAIARGRASSRRRSSAPTQDQPDGTS